MKKISSLLSVTILIAVLIPASVYAAKPVNNGGGGGGKPPATTTEMIGYDVSYPQCGKKLPNDHYFGIVGVNGGNAASVNQCLADQLVWASRAKAGSNQSKFQVYVNTANPAQEPVYDWKTWPTTPYDSRGSLPDNPYGNNCQGQNDRSCSWLYGWNRSIYTEGLFKNAAMSKGLNSNTSEYIWWLDVETMNSWQSGSNEALIRNTAAIEGFGAYYISKGAEIGLYSTEYQWGVITGNNISEDSNLVSLPNWRPSGSNLNNAKTNCNVAPMTAGGYISLTQYVQKNLDHNHSCI